MRKKFLVLLLAGMFLVGCSSKQEEKKTTDSTKTEEKKEESKKDETKKDSIGFDGKVAELNDLKIEIIEYKIIKVGEKGNEYGSKPVIAFW